MTQVTSHGTNKNIEKIVKFFTLLLYDIDREAKDIKYFLLDYYETYKNTNNDKIIELLRDRYQVENMLRSIRNRRNIKKIKNNIIKEILKKTTRDIIEIINTKVQDTNRENIIKHILEISVILRIQIDNNAYVGDFKDLWNNLYKQIFKSLIDSRLGPNEQEEVLGKIFIFIMALASFSSLSRLRGRYLQIFVR